MRDAYWSVVIPVKTLRTAKTRIDVGNADSRIALARAMALDTIEAALACTAVDEVIVVTDEAEIAADAGELGADVVADAPRSGLNAALEHGAFVVRERRPGADIAAVAADLPALKPSDLVRVLRAAAEVARAVVPDAAGVGTVALTARGAADLSPAFGDGSLARHVDSGAVAVGIDVPSVRRDVDTVTDLRDALRLGCGPRTTALAATLLPD